ncbi:hypothetical protein NDU88_001493 [Pleurodeles waltl]|uniref:Uncharacterized protein n=1 Tax=Pleurodeles waltl TaxID=8319 RepID=A0AAV7VXS1_PLEWA|nr:hypothetical protein NDU88_001493 [Pleurodeles waltl]
MRWPLLILCVFAQTYAAPIEEQGANSDVSQYQKMKDDVQNFRKSTKCRVHLKERIPNHQTKSEYAKENLALPKDHQTSVVSFVDNAHFEKRYSESRHEIVHKSINKSHSTDAQRIGKKNPKLNTNVELIFHDSQVTVKAVQSKKKKGIERVRVRPENFSPSTASALVMPDRNTAPGNKSSDYYTRIVKGATNDTVGYRNMKGNDNTVSGIEDQDTGMSSGSGDYFTEEIISKDRDVLVQQHSISLDRENGFLSSTATTTVSSDHTEALDTREKVLEKTHAEQVDTSDTEAMGTQKHSECDNSFMGIDKRKIAHCNTFVAANKTSICIEFDNNVNTKQIMDLPSACRTMSHKVEPSGRAKNVDAQTIQYSKGTPISRGPEGHSQTKLEENDTFRNSRQSRQGQIYQGLGKSSKEMNVPMHGKLPKRKVTHGQRNYDSNSSSGSSSESGQSGSDSGQSK